jgi:uncharacterized protein YndB with AHSA1/START domain
MQLPHSLNRHLWIRAPRETVFAYFTDSNRWAAWWGAGSTIDSAPGGRMLIRYPNGVEVAGEVLAVNPPSSIAFTYGYRNGQPIPEGGSRVTIHLAEENGGTRLELKHEFSEAAVRDHHVQGWRYQLSVFANVVCDFNFSAAQATVDAWFAAWAEPDDLARAATFASIAEVNITFADRWSCLSGREDISAHSGAAQKFMPGVKLTRRGPIRHCQGLVLVDWTAGEKMSGSNVFEFSPSGKLRAVTGWSF